MNTLKPFIGLEIHVELATKCKMFCGCPADHFAKKPNTQTCPVCLGMPGGLPVPNKKAVDWAMTLALALGCTIPTLSKFDRKNYFYPDLPKGYQISQYDMPLGVHGKLGNVRIRRVHLEEDTGKLVHQKDKTLVDFNRSGVALVEIVTEPDIHTSEDAKTFLKQLYQVIRYLGISEADMEKGSMRLEPNISVGTGSLPDYKVEVKNINSFNFVKKAIDYEIKRHSDLVKEGKTPVQETRGWDEDKGVTYTQRRKEEAEDYRYFPEPDIPPMRFASAKISDLRKQIPELPNEKYARFKKAYTISDYDAGLLTDTKELADYFEACVKIGKVPAKKLANWIINKKVDINETMPAALVAGIVKASQVKEISDDMVKQVLKDNPKAVDDFKKGKEQSLMFLVGQLMRLTKGTISASAATQKIKDFITHI